MGDVVEQRHRRIEQAVTEGLLEVGECEQLLAQLRSILQGEPPDAADPVLRLAPLDGAGLDGRMPALVPVEVPDHVPHRGGRCVDDGAAKDARHGSASESALEGVETALEDARPDRRDELRFPLRRAVELGRPFQERTVPVGDRGEAQGGDVIRPPSGIPGWNR
jgi:hypothetical protein